nr:DExH-box ATP-dependent RNA helicase DExH11 isoform X1 [Ipomoea trifida]
MAQNKCHGCVKLDENIKLAGEMKRHKEELERLEFQMSDEALQQMPDFLGRIDVLLKEIGCIDADLVVQIKGRVAYEMNSGEEPICTERLFENQMDDLEPEEAVAIMIFTTSFSFINCLLCRITYGDEHKLAGFSATLQAIISFVENGGDRVKLIRAGKHQVSRGRGSAAQVLRYCLAEEGPPPFCPLPSTAGIGREVVALLDDPRQPPPETSKPPSPLFTPVREAKPCHRRATPSHMVAIAAWSHSYYEGRKLLPRLPWTAVVERRTGRGKRCLPAGGW